MINYQIIYDLSAALKAMEVEVEVEVVDIVVQSVEHMLLSNLLPLQLIHQAIRMHYNPIVSTALHAPDGS